MKVGFIGLGAMGAPMAGHVAGKGLLSVVGNRTVEKATRFAAEHGVNAASVSRTTVCVGSTITATAS